MNNLWFEAFATRTRRWMIAIIAGTATLAACNDLSLKPPAGTIDPVFYATPEAALQMGRSARYEFQKNLLDYLLESGLVADELFDKDTAKYLPGELDVRAGDPKKMVLDQRYLPDETLLGTQIGDLLNRIVSYGQLQRVRSVTSLARRALAQYAQEQSGAFQAELLAYEALAEIMLADLYCSGIPLSTVDYGGDYTYTPGRRTSEVYTHSLHLLDSALSIPHSDANVHALVQVSKGRALLALGRAEDARLAIQSVPKGFKFELPIYRTRGNASDPSAFNWAILVGRNGSVADRKGVNGLPFRTAKDPRVQLDTSTTLPRFPAARSTFVVADYTEAQLIAAEAYLLAGDNTFLTILNDLRTDGIYSISSSGDTVYHAGSGGVAGLSPLTDPAAGLPGASAAARDLRLDMLMYERAFWLFFTGHRQGDLRRLIRNYGRSVETVYPMGQYRGGIDRYDEYVDVPIPEGERFNPYFSGCIGRGE